MRTAKKLNLSQERIRQQDWMDQQYIINVTRSVMGELEITADDFRDWQSPKSFSELCFGNVLHYIMRWNSTTLGKIAAYGLKKGETTDSIPSRRTSLEEAWYGSPLEIDTSGGNMLEWIAATTIVAAAYDILSTATLLKHLKAKAAEGGPDGVSLSEAITSYPG